MAMRSEIADMAREVARLQTNGGGEFRDADAPPAENAWNVTATDDIELVKKLEEKLKLTKREFPQLLPKPLPNKKQQPPAVATKTAPTVDTKIPVNKKEAVAVQKTAPTPVVKPPAVVEAPKVVPKAKPAVVEAPTVTDVVKPAVVEAPAVGPVVKAAVVEPPAAFPLVSKPPGFAGPLNITVRIAQSSDQ